MKSSTYELLHSGRPVLLDLHADPALRTIAAGWSDRVDTVTATRHDPAAPATSLLVRPDGYVAWAAAGDDPAVGLAGALTRWFGPAQG
nr:hypothetical protein GCM10020092_072120 [Actinoplanes digitatis]